MSFAWQRRGAAYAVIGCAALAMAGVTPARSAEAYYRGKTITIVVSTGAAGGYYNLAQAVARHMPRHIDGQPAMTAVAMPGAGNVLATNFMFAKAPRDGTYVAFVNNSIPLHQILGGDGVRYDASRFNWLGSPGFYNSAAYAWRASGVNSLDDLRTREVTLGGTGLGSSIVIYPQAANALAGARFKIILGYKSTYEIDLAMERGELQARTGSYADLVVEHPDWLANSKVTVLFQVGGARDPALPDVPLLSELARTPSDRAILELISSPIALGRPFLAPPETPPERVAELRAAFAETLRDPAFLADVEKPGFRIAPITGDEIAAIVERTIHAPADAVTNAKAIVGDVQ